MKPKLSSTAINNNPSARMIFLAVVPFLLILVFQNCSQHQFQTQDEVTASSLKAGEDDSFVTMEDTALNAEVRSIGKLTFTGSRFQLIGTPINGTVTAFDEATGVFSYMPAKDYYGKDSFTFSELVEGEGTPTIRDAHILVDPANDLPWIEADSFQFPMNSKDNEITAKGRDLEDPNPSLHLTATGNRDSIDTEGGTIKKIAEGKFHYTPKFGFRGLDTIKIYVKDSDGDVNSKDLSILIGNPFRDVQPAMAVRAMGCITCHAQIDSPVITDFGHGDPFFFGKTSLSIGGTVFNDYSTFAKIYADHDSASWLSATFKSKIIVPNANIGIDLKTQVRMVKNTAGVMVPAYDINHARFAAKTVRDYVDAVEADKRAKGKIAATTEVKNKVFIGAPSAAVIRARTSVDAGGFKYYKNTNTSPDLVGLKNNVDFFELSGDVTCDGDLALAKPLFIKDLNLKTMLGCRLYVAGEVFQQGEIKYQSLDSARNLTNLQIVSSEAISMGIGQTHCETTAGWYFDNNKNNETAPGKWTPLKLRFASHLPETRRLKHADKESFYQKLASLATKMKVVDASCRSGADPRNLHFERLLLVAPNIQSRYTGQFTGVIIAEYANFGLSKFSFRFDDVFKSTPVLPLLESADYLVLE